MHKYRVTIYNNGSGARFILTSEDVEAPDPYSACLRATAKYAVATSSPSDSLYQLRRDHLIISKVVQLAEEKLIFDMNL